MTPTDKAKELVERFKEYAAGDLDAGMVDEYKRVTGKEKVNLLSLARFSRNYHAKRCAVLCVMEVKSAMQEVMPHPPFQEYQNKVIDEIEKL